jgi:probable rRNA maturation factor
LDDRQIAELNRQYLQRDYPTDVLAFPMAGEPFMDIQPQVMGDVVISVETAARQARKRKIALEAELACLLIHGILHLRGYDHELSDIEKRRMRSMEKKLLPAVLAGAISTASVKK